MISINVGPITGGAGIANVAESPISSARYLTGLLTTSIGVMSVVAAIWFIFNIISGGLSIMNADGDKVKMEIGKMKITNGALGLAIMFSATFIALLMGFIFQIENMLDISFWVARLRGLTL